MVLDGAEHGAFIECLYERSYRLVEEDQERSGRLNSFFSVLRFVCQEQVKEEAVNVLMKCDLKNLSLFQLGLLKSFKVSFPTEWRLGAVQGGIDIDSLIREVESAIYLDYVSPCYSVGQTTALKKYFNKDEVGFFSSLVREKCLNDEEQCMFDKLFRRVLSDLAGSKEVNSAKSLFGYLDGGDLLHCVLVGQEWFEEYSGRPYIDIREQMCLWWKCLEEKVMAEG